MMTKKLIVVEKIVYFHTGVDLSSTIARECNCYERSQLLPKSRLFPSLFLSYNADTIIFPWKTFVQT